MRKALVCFSICIQLLASEMSLGSITATHLESTGNSIKGKWAVSWIYLSGYQGNMPPVGTWVSTWTFDQAGNWTVWEGKQPGSDVVISGKLNVNGDNISGILSFTYTSIYGPEPSTLNHSGSFKSSNRIEGTVIYHRSNASGYDVTTTFTFVMTLLTASDYYLPLSVGSHVILHTPGGGDFGWSARTTTISIEGTNSISGQQYFREKGSEVLDVTHNLNVFHVFWIRKDSLGDVVIGAMSTTGSSNIDSATTVSGEILFPNEFLTKGYSRTFAQGEQTFQESVLSVTETVSMPTGTFNNCLNISETHFDKTGTVIWHEYHYYAYGIGLVKNVRTIPESEAHTDELMEYYSVASTNPLLGTWVKIDGPASVLKYNYINDLTCTISASDTKTVSYILDTLAIPHHNTWYYNGQKLNLGIWSISGFTLTEKASGGDTTTFPSSFGIESNYNWAASHYIKQTTGVSDGAVNQILQKFSLSQNYPNPFNPTTKIKFELPERAITKLTVYDIIGRKVSILVNQELDAGYHEVNFDASKLSSGIYFYRMQAGNFVETKKLILIK